MPISARPTRSRQVVIVGGGPAGLQAAITAANRGHKVVLFEKEKNLGGALNLAAAHSFKTDMRNYRDWLTRTAACTPGIIIKLNTEATADQYRGRETGCRDYGRWGDAVYPQFARHKSG